MTRINIRDYLHPKEEKTSCEDLTLTQDQKDEILEAFTLYDTDEDGYIDTKELGTVIRSLGQVPTVCEETDIVARFAHERRHEINFITFLKLMSETYRAFDEDDELRESFRRFDKEDSGHVPENDLRRMLTTLGEPLTEEEVDDWLEDGRDFAQNGKLNYEDFASYMLSK